MHNKKANKGGFTLIELLVSIGLFAMVMTMSAGIILSIVGGNKKAQQINSVSNNLNFALESLVRDLKTGYDYYCLDTLSQVKDRGVDAVGRGCGTGGPYDTIQFVSTLAGGERVVSYKYARDANNAGYLTKRFCSIVGNSIQEPCSQYTRVTSPDIDLREVSFYVKASEGGSGDQPGVLIVIRGTTKLERNTASDFHIQTYVSQRVLNI